MHHVVLSLFIINAAVFLVAGLLSAFLAITKGEEGAERPLGVAAVSVLPLLLLGILAHTLSMPCHTSVYSLENYRRVDCTSVQEFRADIGVKGWVGCVCLEKDDR